MPRSLHVVALISGGKDSFFSILHCIHNGHKVIALANLHPPAAQTPDAPAADDIDSFMYQTIGHSIVPLYANALDLPLYRQEIIGSAVNVDKAYSDPDALQVSESDETESLVPLLLKVKQAHPELDAVSTGAILSDYQRTRVESVALRLGLTPLSYLWQYPWLPPYLQTSLLEDMRAVGQESRLIKVASGGLDSRHLWLELAAPDTIQNLAKSLGRFGPLETGAILGEGGEFETLALNGPWPVWKKRISIRDGDWAAAADEGSGGSFAVKVHRAELEDPQESDSGALKRLRVPSLLDDKFSDVLAQLQAVESRLDVADTDTETALSTPVDVPTCQVREDDRQLLCANMVAAEAGTDAASQTRSILSLVLDQYLAPRGLSTASITQTVILLRSMDDFGKVNPAYQLFFTKAGPPSRVTVACGPSMPPGRDVMISAWAEKGPVSDRSALHVQSRSYWAPANIGPYSQAVSVPRGQDQDGRTAYIAGQIPLIPASMELSGEGLAAQAVLSLQHLWRVGQAMKVHWWLGGAVAFVAALEQNSAGQAVRIVSEAWTLAHALERSADEAEDEDIAERSLRGGWGWAGTPSLATPRRPLPDWEKAEETLEAGAASIPPCFVVEVDELPRGAQVEWWSYGLQTQDATNSVQPPVFYPIEHERRQGWPQTWPTGRMTDAFISTNDAETLARAREANAMVIPAKRIWTSDGQRLAALFRAR